MFCCLNTATLGSLVLAFVHNAFFALTGTVYIVPEDEDFDFYP
ncbi:MAG: hypothetical protein ACOCRL_01625 [Bacillota bacterium]